MKQCHSAGNLENYCFVVVVVIFHLFVYNEYNSFIMHLKPAHHDSATLCMKMLLKVSRVNAPIAINIQFHKQSGA